MIVTTMKNMRSPGNGFPKISIVTPSLNQGHFLEESILSVIGQSYPNLEYIVLDGGSSDNSVEIIRKYEKHISFWESKKDNGQAAAINRGFSLASGDILGWLNSDDFYLPGALFHVAAKIESAMPQLLFGDCVVIREDRDNRAYAMRLKDREKQTDLLNGSLAQSSAFWTRKTWFQVGPLDAGMHYAFDLEWFNRAKSKGIHFIHVPKHLSVYRSHEVSKTISGGGKRLQEIALVYGKFRNSTYESAFRFLVEKRRNVKRLNRMITKLAFFGNADLKRILLRLFFPALRHIQNEDFEFFVKRIVGPEKKGM
jgi:glycosyltransferase involved in cell wall biosynthesis